MTSNTAIISGVKWTSVSTFGRRILALAANIVMARLLLPADFGLVAMAAIILSFIETFKDLGTGFAVMREKEPSDEFLSSIFWLNAGFGLFVTLAAVGLSPLVGAFFHEPMVSTILKAMALSFLLSALSIVQNALLARAMEFDKIAKIELSAACISYVVGIGAALLGHGVWSLVYQVLVNSLLSLVMTWMASRWRPKMYFRWERIRSVLSYSLNLTGYNIFYFFALNADNLLIGRFLGAEQLGYYDLAYRLMSFPLQAISAVFGRVMTPYYSQAQDDLVRFRAAFLQVAAAIAFVTFPLMVGLLATRDHFVMAVFGPNWMSVATLLALFAPLGAIRSILTTTGSIYTSMGRADLQLRWGIVSNLIVIAALAVGVRWGSVGVAAAFTGSSILLLYHNLSIPFKLIDLKISALLSRLGPTTLCAALMYLVLLGTDAALPAAASHSVDLAVMVGVGILAYFLATWLFNRTLLDQALALCGVKKPAPSAT
jgi:O-antigen/teichoic acid export membrane protein